MDQLKEIQRIAESLLGLEPEPIPRFRIIRDLLRQPSNSDDYLEAKRATLESKWAKFLEGEQHPDGSWGRFHTENTKRKQKHPTTQFAVSRGLEIGLRQEDVVFKAAVRYMDEVLRDRRRWADAYESSVWFAPGVKLFTASSLSKIDPNHQAISPVWKQWNEVFQKTLESGRYDQHGERTASLSAIGVDTSGSYIAISAAPNLELFGERSHLIPERMQRTLIGAIWKGEVSPVYLRNAPGNMPKSIVDHDFIWWFHTLKVMSRFSAWGEAANETIEWFWNQRDSDGFWDGSSRVGRNVYLPISENWRRSVNRKIDYTTQICILLRRLIEDK